MCDAAFKIAIVLFLALATSGTILAAFAVWIAARTLLS